MTTDGDRLAYLAGDGPGGLDDAEKGELDELRALLADRSVWAEPDARLEDAIVDAIAVEGRRDAVGMRRRNRRNRWPCRPRWPVPVVGAAVAAGLVVAVAISNNGNDKPTTLEAALQPTPLAPGASGHATLTKTDGGWRVELDATGLPRLDGGRFYQAWLRNKDGILVPIGTFNEPDDIVLWAGVSPLEFPTLTVTEEAADDQPGSSGRRVLTGVATG
jgi:hypothetical protein